MSEAPSAQTVLVIGAGGKAGRAVCTSMKTAGYRVIGARRGLSEFDSDSTVESIRLDLSDTASHAEMVESLPGGVQQLRGVVVCAADFYRGSATELTPEKLSSLIATNVAGTINLITLMAVSALMNPFDIVNITAVSAASMWDASRSSAAHVASKVAMQAFDTLVGLELDERGIRVASLAPGTLEKEPSDGGIPTTTIADAVQFIFSLPTAVRCESLVIRPTRFGLNDA